MTRLTWGWLPVVLTLAAPVAGCSEDDPEDGTVAVVAEQRAGVWVFSYAEDPTSGMDALAGGPAVIDGDCLLLGDAVVIWTDDQLDTVDDIIARVQDGETLQLQVGGGGLSLEEGSTEDDFPAEVMAYCAPTEVWFANGDEVGVETEGE